MYLSPGIDIDRFVKIDIVHDILVDDDGFSELIVPLHIFGYGIGDPLVLLLVFDDIVSGGRESRTLGDLRFESGILDEVQFGLQVLAPELQIASRHLLVFGLGYLELVMFLGVTYGIAEFLRA